MTSTALLDPDSIGNTVRQALQEDIGDGDITAALIPTEQRATAKVICRESAIICGKPWVDETIAQVDDTLQINWQIGDGYQIEPDATVFTLSGAARSILTAERTALNFLQLLSGTATLCRHYADRVSTTDVRLLDTRKTVPGLRRAQKYAVSCGGCHNHRIGLYDAFLIKENHIAACGSIRAAVTTAQSNHPDKPVEVEVETLAQLQQALDAGADIIMLDNFELATLKEAVAITDGRAKLEASGNVEQDGLTAIAATGVDYISIGALTKHLRAIDFSMRIV